MDARLTQHARIRMRQRGIGADALDCLVAIPRAGSILGREAFDHRGHAVIVYFDKKDRRRLARTEPHRKDVERLARRYAVLSAEGDVLTVGHRFRRIGRG